MNIITSLLVGCIKAYQRLLSPLLGQHCRFSPTCSQYAVDAFKKHSFFYALLLTIKRILRCHPWHPGGHDPIP